MKNRVVRIALVVLALAAQAAAGFFVSSSEQALASARSEAAVLAGDAARAQALIGDLRASQTGLVANGQDPSFWVPRVAALAEEATAAIEKIDRGRLAADAAQDLAAAAAALADFTRASDRVRGLLATDQPLTASALAFGDAARHLATVAGALTGVVSSQAAAADREAARRRSREGLALAGAAALTLLALLLLLPRASQETTPAEAEGPATSLALPLTMPSASDLDGLGRSGFDLDIRRPAAPLATAPLPEEPRESEEAIVDDLTRETALPLNTEAPVDLAAAARLCSDLARVKDAGQLPVLLARAAEHPGRVGHRAVAGRPRGHRDSAGGERRLQRPHAVAHEGAVRAIGQRGVGGVPRGPDGGRRRHEGSQRRGGRPDCDGRRPRRRAGRRDPPRRRIQPVGPGRRHDRRGAAGFARRGDDGVAAQGSRLRP